MAVRTYIPAILLVAGYLKRYIAKHSEKLIANLGEGAYSVLVLAVDVIIIFANLCAGNSDANGTFQSPMATLTSPQINQIQGAYVKWLETNGLGEG